LSGLEASTKLRRDIGIFGYAVVLLLLAGRVSSAYASDVPLDERDWSLVTSENFRVHTVLGEERTAELLRHLEVMRAALDERSTVATFQADVPTVIIALDNESDYLLIGAPVTTVGVFIADQRENAIVVQDNDNVQGTQTILHEYVHYLHRKNGRIAYPRWYSEGAAEYLSSSSVTETSFDVGLPLAGRVGTLAFVSWLPIQEIIEVTDTSVLTLEQGDLFYSQSWLLVHYLNSQENTEGDLPDQLQRYSELMTQGIATIDAFEVAFSIPTDKLDDLLLKYFLAGDFASKSVPMDTALPNFAPTIETISIERIQIALAEMAMRFDNDVVAEEWYSKALENDDTRALAAAGLGTVFGHRGETLKARDQFEAAIYLVSYDFRMWMDYAQFWAERLSTTYDAEQQNLFAKRLEEALRNALTISDATPELNTLMGFAYLAQEKDTGEAIEFLLAATEQSPTDQGSRLLLANAYYLDGNYVMAIDSAESLLSLEHEPNEVTASAREIIRKSERPQRLTD
jgi:Tfp pilus assembly protein PilF